ncbi:hypothetical protein NP303_24790, partial [Salmonella enterica]|nr:hypothetical protein [Salmonella enterica]
MATVIIKPVFFIEAGATFVFGSWLCIADGAGSFRRQIVNAQEKKSEDLVRKNQDFKVNNLEFDYASDSTSLRTSRSQSVPKSVSTSKRFPHGLRNATKVHQGFLARTRVELGHDEDVDSNSSYPPEIPLSGPAQGLVITSTSQGRFVHWPGLRPSFLDRDYDSRLVAHIDNLPYQEGIPLTSNCEESSTEIATSSSGSYYPDREVFVITQNNNPGTSQNRTPRRLAQLDNISEDESTADAPQNETSDQRNQRRMRNATRAERRQTLATNIPITNLERAFDAVQAQEHNTPLAAIPSINLLTTLMPQEMTTQSTNLGNTA